MENEARLIKIFSEALGITLKMVNDDLQYNSIPEWDSIAHMALVASLESEFDIMMDTDDIIDMNTVEKAKEILEKYSISFS